MSAELNILQHALGVGPYGDNPSHRNHFVTGAGSVDYPVCTELVAKGLMVMRPMSISLTGGGECFVVTPDGRDYVGLNNPKRPTQAKLSPGKARYRRYLQCRDAFTSFIDFCKWDTRPAAVR